MLQKIVSFHILAHCGRKKSKMRFGGNVVTIHAARPTSSVRFLRRFGGTLSVQKGTSVRTIHHGTACFVQLVDLADRMGDKRQRFR